MGHQGSKFHPAPHGPTIMRVPLETGSGGRAFQRGDTQRGDSWREQGLAGAGLHQAHGCPTSVPSTRLPIHPSTPPSPTTQRSWMSTYFLKPLASSGATTPTPSQVPDMPTSVIPQGLFSILQPLSALVPLQHSQFALQTFLRGLPAPHLGKASNGRVSGVRRI